MSNRKSVVVCGATGMVGSHLVGELLKSEKYDIKVIARREESIKNLKTTLRRLKVEDGFDRLNIFYGRLDDVEFLSQCFAGCHTIYSCAAAVDFSVKESQLLIRNNTLIISCMVEAARRSNTYLIVHTGSIATLKSNGTPATENHHISTLQNKSAYSVSKFFSDSEIEKAALSGINTVIVQPSVILGSGDWSHKHISGIVDMVYKGMPFSFNGVTGYVDSVDVARAMVVVSENEETYGHRFILNAQNLSYKELFDMFAEALNVKRRSILISDPILKTTVKTISALQKMGIHTSLNSTTIDCLHSKCRYDGTKIERLTKFRYSPIKESIQRIATDYISEQKKLGLPALSISKRR